MWRHLPLNDVHPDAQLAAEGSEAAAAQGKFWEMYDTLLAHQDELSLRRAHPLRRRARSGRRPVQSTNSADREYASRVSEDVASADESGVSGTPTFFINGRRHYGVYDIDTLTSAVQAAKNRARGQRLAATNPPADTPEPKDGSHASSAGEPAKTPDPPDGNLR